MTVQVFLRQLLKSKMAKLKRFYEPYEDAFFQIKSNTSVKDANSLKTEFFNFENNYNEKTVWVKFMQNDIQECEVDNKKLQERLIELRNQEMEIIEKMEEEHKVTE